MQLTNNGSGQRQGPLAGLRVVELAGIGPAPFGAMLLADLGAEVTRIDKYAAHAGNPLEPRLDLLTRGRRAIQLDLKDDDDRAVARALVAGADVLVEGFRPGVAERLGLGPDVCLELNPRLVYGRMTGWGQEGPLAQRAGHDINYISLAGALSAIGPTDGAPVIPSNFLGDFGGGGMLLALGVLAAVHHARETGQGQVVDASIVDGTALLTTMQHAFRAQGLLHSERGDNMLDGGAHFYQVYETADGRYLSVGAIEPQFYREFVSGLGEALEGAWASSHTDRSQWPIMIDRVAAIVGRRPLEDWMRVFEGTDACVTGVLTLDEAIRHPHNVARGTFTRATGLAQPAPAPRFSATPLAAPSAPVPPGAHSAQIRDEVAARQD
jgi:alpha-methylacyl-CoA racemase